MQAKVNSGRDCILGTMLSSAFMTAGCADLDANQTKGANSEGWDNPVSDAASLRVEDWFEGGDFSEGEEGGWFSLALALKELGNPEQDIVQANRMANEAQSVSRSTIGKLSVSGQVEINSTIVSEFIAKPAKKMADVVRLYNRSIPAAKEEAITQLVLAATRAGKSMVVFDGGFGLLFKADGLGNSPHAGEHAAASTGRLARGSTSVEQSKLTAETIEHRLPPARVISNHGMPDHEEFAPRAPAFATSQELNPGGNIKNGKNNFKRTVAPLKEAEAAARASFVAALGGQSIDTT